ncbi:MAG: carbon-nitrogen hydrolase family protein [Candidatus Eisenbacteria bacterium]|uniref:Carbon-nitrogen hydrolase family protein n=1 Tax=Eiseniibacteriota bacterium TaxID=2212470 RepID=A0A538U8G4_UNCEI|nr:MAG: carbon-nitrogen hydrolase family protein [Candidatus Eisenbacteria bacterium]
MARAFRAAAVQAAPVFLDRDATIEKACDLIADAAREGARLIVLPEAFVPAYPAWVWVLPLTRRAEIAQLYAELVSQSIAVPGPETERLAAAARAARAFVTIGVNERNDQASRTTLFNTLLMFDDEGRLRRRHRKLMATGGERMVWAASQEADLVVEDTPLGRLSGLICWENYMPLARYALYAQGAEVHVAPTWDRSEQWLATLRHVAREGRAWVIGCCQALHRSGVPARYAFLNAFPPGTEWINPGNSAIVDPEGLVVAGPLEAREGILHAEIEPGRAQGSRWIFDAAGHYSRSDLFTFAVNDGAQASVAAPRAKAKMRRRAKSAARSRARARRGTRR